MRRTVVAAAVVAALAACSGSDPEPYVERPVEELYNIAMSEVGSGNYKAAAKAFDEVERQHPYSSWATRAQLMAAYSYYEAEDYDDAIIALDRFIQLHPGNPDVPYAYYLKALCYYEQVSSVARDQKMTRLAHDALQEVVNRFPTSEYARDAKLKLDLTVDHMAGKEMDVGRYYLRQKQYLAAINRFKAVVDGFQTTSHVPEALYRMVEAYSLLGMQEEAMKTAAVLGHNYPGSEWYEDAYSVAQGGQPVTDTARSRGWLPSLPSLW
ncbi:outer membrane protein assembly factor BamD [Caenispirillum bisanense]|uniref:outer membrane protein assembly factor BamD n=1 Tax=Caenispirillum bisanense TaxID=414052 RepID=UPI0031D92B09